MVKPYVQIILGFSSFLIEPMCRKVGPRVVWVTSNFMVCVAMAATALISFWSLKDYHGYVQDAITASTSIKAVCLVLFAFLGVPLAVSASPRLARHRMQCHANADPDRPISLLQMQILYSVPFAVTAQLAATKGGGQGLCTGVLNISIVIPQVIIALGAGPWDALFGKGNIPAFGVASGFALIGGVVGVFLLPKISKRQFRAVSAGGH
jgi:solute carrier family 45, member 1/2/4